jgi:hypothetical protein
LLHTFDGEPVGDGIDQSCGNADITQVRVCWQADDGSEPDFSQCIADQMRQFGCNKSSGISNFEITPGRNSFWIVPVCDDGSVAAIGTYQVPPPIVRTVEEGGIVTLGSLLIVATDNTDPSTVCPSPNCTCVRPP